MSNFYIDVIQKSPLFHTTNRVNDLNMLFPAFRTKIEALLIESEKSEAPLMVLETFRSSERQLQLYEAKATQLKTVGVHHYGLAVDIVKKVNGEPSFFGDFSFLGKLAKNQGLIWGGDWGEPNKPHTFRDMDHIQFIPVSDQNKLFAGTWYPS